MRRKNKALKGRPSILGDREWITVIGALLKDHSPQSRCLAQKLLMGTKHGRHVRLLRLLQTQNPTVREMQKAMRASRRTIFRDLNNLEEYGVRLRIDGRFGYRVERLPECCRRLL